MQTRAGMRMTQANLRCVELAGDQQIREHVCKTILFKRKDGVRVAVLIPLEHRVSYKKLKAHCGMDVAPLSADELRAEGFEPGEVAPMLVECDLLVDPTCPTGLIRTGSGTLGYGLEWQFADLAQLKRYVVLDVRDTPSQPM